MKFASMLLQRVRRRVFEQSASFHLLKLILVSVFNIFYISRIASIKSVVEFSRIFQR